MIITEDKNRPRWSRNVDDRHSGEPCTQFGVRSRDNRASSCSSSGAAGRVHQTRYNVRLLEMSAIDRRLFSEPASPLAGSAVSRQARSRARQSLKAVRRCRQQRPPLVAALTTECSLPYNNQARPVAVNLPVAVSRLVIGIRA
jgi:hypothetical protein